MRKSFAFSSFCLALALASLSQAATLSMGNYILQPNTANQQIQIFGSGGEDIQGIELGLQILPVNNEGPTITGITINGPGTFFGANSFPPQIAQVPGNPRFWTADVGTLADTIPLTSTLPIAMITVSTVGLSAKGTTQNFTVDLSPAQAPTL